MSLRSLTACRIDTELVIPAGPAAVWAVFGDFANWHTWNDFMALPRPPKAVGDHCRVVFALDGGCIKRSTHDPEILVLEENKELRWRDWRNVVFSTFFRGSHWWVLEPLPNGHTRFVHGAEMMGLAIPFLAATMTATRKGYEEFNRALCDEVLGRTRRHVGKQAVS